MLPAAMAPREAGSRGQHGPVPGRRQPPGCRTAVPPPTARHH